MKKVFFYEENFEDRILEENMIGQGYESKVYTFDDKVIKIFGPEFQNRLSQKRIKALSKLVDLEPYLTLPIASVYLDFHFIGYMMNYGGINLKRYLLDNNLSDMEIIEILKTIKDILEYLHKMGFVHGDLQPKNILYNNGVIKISDINNAQFGRFKADLLNDMTMYLSDFYGCTYLLDVLTLNYYTYVLLNLRGETRRQFIEYDAEGYALFCEGEYHNHVFVPDVCEEQMDYLLNPRGNKKKALNNSKYLIDYLK